MGLSSYMYNGYLLFTTNTILEKDNSNFEDSEDYFSIFMAFSYGNGTDDTIYLEEFREHWYYYYVTF